MNFRRPFHPNPSRIVCLVSAEVSSPDSRTQVGHGVCLPHAFQQVAKILSTPGSNDSLCVQIYFSSVSLPQFFVTDGWAELQAAPRHNLDNDEKNYKLKAS